MHYSSRMLETPVGSEEVRAILEEVDESVVARIVATGASIDEISEAMHLVVDRMAADTPSSGRVVRLCAILRDARGR
jgi:hypothetical protein